MTTADAPTTGAPATGDAPWRRLSPRLFWVDLIRAALASVPGYLGLVVLGDDGPVWPLVAASAFGVLQAVSDLVRLLTTRYRVLDDRVELHSGWVARRRRTVARDRIRSADTTAKLLHRPFGLRVVRIGTGEQASSFTLDALDARSATRLQRELLAQKPATAGEPTGDETTGNESTAVAPGDVIARLRPAWVLINAVRVWAVLAVIGPVFAVYWFLRAFGVDLLDTGLRLYTALGLGPVWTIVLGVAVAYPIGVVMQAGAFLTENWRFTLTRDGGTLITRRGLLDTHTAQRDEQRVRGLAFKEPLVWRWLRITETLLITTGLRSAGEAGSATLLPRVRQPEARAVAARVLTDGHRPLEARLHRHPRGALTRRLIRAVTGPVLLTAVLGGFTLSGAIPGRWWLLPLTFLPLTLVLAVAGYRALGHAMAGPYLVLRRGALTRLTVALRRDAVIGWTLRQSLFQRWGGRITIGVSTAAGDRFYHTEDAGTEQAIALIRAATPELAAQFAEPFPAERPARSGAVPAG
ncbi:putative membrane protein [Catenuloplanes nepalensis]|uniref:Membrane protein n=1 Tax=Catenuloplanes nepalensis TaxID=587533 RepID=A0ABT9MR68_9ACTN|nr:PH domain-containing protein [Catenuloplanes nepalensis]MDP9793925.1 putative membrane protein [Catenuloplanes nepalensis]